MEVPLSRVRLVVVFNHRYDANLATLDAVYGERFPDRRYLMPFYDGDRDDVIAVHETSFCFQGYFAQAFGELVSDDVSHYAFVADDLLLHPDVNAANLVQRLELDEESGWVKELRGIGHQPLDWPHMRRSLAPFLERNGVDWQGQLPSYDEAAALLAEHGVDVGVHRWADARGLSLRGPRGRRGRWALAYLHQQRGRRRPPYPLAVSYSDFVVVPAAAAPTFVRYCGVMAAMGVFVEAAIPTALALSLRRIRTEADTSWIGRELWSAEEEAEVHAAHGGSLTRLGRAFAPDQLWLHPVKLSRWSALPGEPDG